jgi:ribosomal protein L11 methyltransferase
VSRLLQVELTVPAKAVEAVSGALEQLGAQSVSLGDPGGEPILAAGPSAVTLWPTVVLTALLPAEVEELAVRERLARLPGVAPDVLSFAVLENRDWLREFRESLLPLRFGERLWICPPGVPCPDAVGVTVTLEPGLAFGSGAHPSTALCLRWLSGMQLDGCSVLDWGCGSGVLALAALALGARDATAIDVDPQALRATAENARRNRCAHALRISDPAGVPPAERYDVVVANILADSLIDLAPALRRHSSPGARVALGGILTAQAERVREACVPWLHLRLTEEFDGWALLSGTACTPVVRAAAPRSE